MQAKNVQAKKATKPIWDHDPLVKEKYMVHYNTDV
jgi:hypothetical protein